jgi:hypothetical protein
VRASSADLAVYTVRRIEEELRSSLCTLWGAGRRRTTRPARRKVTKIHPCVQMILWGERSGYLADRRNKFPEMADQRARRLQCNLHCEGVRPAADRRPSGSGRSVHPHVHLWCHRAGACRIVGDGRNQVRWFPFWPGWRQAAPRWQRKATGQESDARTRDLAAARRAARKVFLNLTRVIRGQASRLAEGMILISTRETGDPPAGISRAILSTPIPRTCCRPDICTSSTSISPK